MSGITAFGADRPGALPPDPRSIWKAKMDKLRASA